MPRYYRRFVRDSANPFLTHLRDTAMHNSARSEEPHELFFNCLRRRRPNKKLHPYRGSAARDSVRHRRCSFLAPPLSRVSPPLIRVRSFLAVAGVVVPFRSLVPALPAATFAVRSLPRGRLSSPLPVSCGYGKRLRRNGAALEAATPQESTAKKRRSAAVRRTFAFSVAASASACLVDLKRSGKRARKEAERSAMQTRTG